MRFGLRVRGGRAGRRAGAGTCGRDALGGWVRAKRRVSSTVPAVGRRADKCGIHPDDLERSVARFNEFARAGKDLDFHRGDSAYDRYYGDASVKPNPNLGVIENAPFLAARMVPGDLGTKGGLLTDEHARVLRADGSVIRGLYASGNTTASVMGRTYPGPGATLGPSVTFAFIGAHHALDGVLSGGDP